VSQEWEDLTGQSGHPVQLPDMPRSSFQKLLTEQLGAVLEIAAREVGEHGFEGPDADEAVEAVGATAPDMTRRMLAPPGAAP